MSFLFRYDFYLISQSIREGTVSPTGFNIIHDTMGIPPDRIQLLTFRFTYFYVSILKNFHQVVTFIWNSKDSYRCYIANFFKSSIKIIVPLPIYFSSTGAVRFEFQHYANMLTNWLSSLASPCKLHHRVKWPDALSEHSTSCKLVLRHWHEFTRQKKYFSLFFSLFIYFLTLKLIFKMTWKIPMKGNDTFQRR